MSLSPRASLAALMLWTAVPVGIVGVLASAPAHAQQAAFDGPIVELVGGGEVIATGKPVTLHFVAYTKSGNPMTGLTGKVSGELGKGPIAEVRPGVYKVDLEVAAVAQRKRAELTLSAKTLNKGDVERSYMVSLAPSITENLAVTTNPPRLTLGQDDSATVTVKVPGNAASADIAIEASVGEIRNVVNMGDGRFVAQYLPPAQQFPQFALITAVDRQNPGKVMGSNRLELVGKTNFPVQGKPNSAVILQVGEREFGPVQADASGKATIPVVVPPGYPTAKIISIENGQRSESTLDLQVPPSKPIQLFPTTALVPADSSKRIPLRAWVTRPNGKPAETADVSFTVTAGQVGEAKHVGGGHYEAIWTPPVGSTATSATIQATVMRDGKAIADAMNVDLGPTRARAVTVNAEPPDLAPGDAGFQIYAKARGLDDVPLAGRTLVIDALGATASGPARDLGGGDYQVSFAAVSGSPSEIAVAVPPPASTNPVHRVLVLPTSGQVTVGGQDVERIAIATVDRYGYPVANQDVELQVLTGDGTLPTKVNTGAEGVRFVSYKSGAKSGWVSVRASAAKHVGTAGFIQAPESVQPILAPVSNKAGVAALHTSWADSIALVRLARSGTGGGTVVAAAPVPTAGGPVARVSAVSEPSSVAAGGSVKLMIRPVDASGAPVQVSDFSFMSSTGSISQATPAGGGTYTATLSVPDDATGEVMVTVGAAGGSVATMLKVPVSGSAVAAAGAWGQQPAEAQPEQKPEEKPAEEAAPDEPKKEKAPKEKKPKEAREKGEHPWLHAQLGYMGGVYNYYQVPTQTGGLLYDDPITVGFGESDRAGTFGLQANVRGWLPFLEYVGFDAGFKGSRWQISLPEGFDEPIADGLNALHAKAMGRYFFDIEKVRLSGGGGIGMQFNDLLYFSVDRATTADGADVPEYAQLWTAGMTYHFEGGVEVDDFFWAQAGYELGVTDYSALFSDRIYVETGYAFVDNWYVFGNFDSFHRSTKVYFGDDKAYVGNLEDRHLRFGGGIGFQY